MTELSEALMTDTCQACARMSPAEAQASIRRLGHKQPALLAYVLVESESLSRAAGELLVYLLFVIARAFYASGQRLRPVPPAAIDACASQLEARLLSLQGAHEAFMERAAAVLSGSQPHAFRYLVEAVVEAPSEPTDPIPLTPEEEGAIFLAIAMAITVLDQHCLPASPP